MTFEDYKNLTLWELVKVLQRKTRINALLIRKNSDEILRLISERKHNESEDLKNENRALIKQNQDNILLHNKLLQFFNLINKKAIVVKEPLFEEHAGELVAESAPVDIDDVFSKTIQNEYVFNQTHPFYCSQTFRDRLMEYYISIEDYEKCEVLVNKNCV